MTFQVNRPVLAIEDLVGAKTWGRMIAQAGEELQFTFDLQRSFLGARQSSESLTNSINALGAFLAVNVPANEAWYLYRQSAVTATLAAGNTCGFSCFYSQFRTPPLGSGLAAIYGPPGRVAAVGEQAIASMECDIWLPPGAAYGVHVFNFAGANISVQLNAHIAKISV